MRSTEMIFAACIIAAVVTILLYRLLQAGTDLIGLGRGRVRRRLNQLMISRNPGDADDLEEKVQSAIKLIRFLREHVPPFGRIHALAIKAGQEDHAARYMILTPVLAVLIAVPAAMLSHSFVLTGILFALGAALPAAMLSVLVDRRLLQLEEQLPDALDFMARAMRAGHGLTVALGMLATEMPAPIGPQFRTVLEEVNFGIPFHEALRRAGERVDSADLRFFVSAILIQRETGGNLAELLQGLADTVRERLKLKGRVKVLAAEGKAAGMILSVLPFLLAGGMWAMNPEYMSILWTSESGQTLTMFAAGLIVIGRLWMNRLTRVKV